MRIGIISDTHGYLDPRIAPAFTGVDAIVLAGDVGSQELLDELQKLAPLHAVHGNNDERLGALGLPLHLDVVLDGVPIHIVHQLPHARPRADTRVVVFGHSHRTLVEQRGDILYVNPGAAGRAGFHRTQTVALIDIEGAAVDARIVELGPRETLPKRTPTRRKAG